MTTPPLGALAWQCADLPRSCAALAVSLAALAVVSTATAEPPPGAIVLFGGDDTAQWVGSSGGAAPWNITNDLLTVVPGSGNIYTFQTFADMQLHLEFRFLTNSPPGTPEGNLANSGVFLQDQFEIQIMESYNRSFGGMNDSGIVYLNGTEIFRSNMRDGPVTYTDWAPSAVGNADERIYFTTHVPPGLLLEGMNQLAVEIHQQSATSSDVSFDLRLTALAYHEPSLTVGRAAGQLELSWPAAPPSFTLQSSTNLAPGSWMHEPNAPDPLNGFLKTTVSPALGSRYYRLIRN